MSFLSIFVACSSVVDSGVLNLSSESSLTGQCKVGERVQISLVGNPTTGYSWTPLDNGLPSLAFASRNYVSDNPELCGAGGVETFSYTAVQKGVSFLRFQYGRSWEKKTLRTLEFRVSVMP